jgi:hypothetical protein
MAQDGRGRSQTETRDRQRDSIRRTMLVVSLSSCSSVHCASALRRRRCRVSCGIGSFPSRLMWSWIATQEGPRVRGRADPRVLGQDPPAPAQPRREPRGQPRPVADRHHPDERPSRNPRPRPAAHGGRAVEEGGHPLPQVLRRPRGLPLPATRRLTRKPPGRPGPLIGCRRRAGLRTIRRPPRAHSHSC